MNFDAFVNAKGNYESADSWANVQECDATGAASLY